MAIRAAASNGESAKRHRPKSERGLKTCICPHRKRARNPRPLKANDEWPDGKLRQPSWRVCESVSVHTSYVTSLCWAVPLMGLHRARRSGRGRPTAFLITSVTKDVNIILKTVSFKAHVCFLPSPVSSMRFLSAAEVQIKVRVNIETSHLCHTSSLFMRIFAIIEQFDKPLTTFGILPEKHISSFLGVFPIKTLRHTSEDPRFTQIERNSITHCLPHIPGQTHTIKFKRLSGDTNFGILPKGQVHGYREDSGCQQAAACARRNK